VNKMLRKQSRKGFSLVELLAVVLVLAVLAAVAIPLYTSQRKSAAGRTCKANLAAISSSLSAFALRKNVYPTSTQFTATDGTGIIGAAEGLTELPKCPLGANGGTGTGAYTYTAPTGSGGAGACTLACPNASSHDGYGGVTADYTKTLAAPASDSLP
jgi:prepilin-type N-terminal cleavage/methylation domain-containing protein